MSASDVQLEDVINAAIDASKFRLRTHLIGRIESYDADRRRASVQALVMDGDVDEEGQRTASPIAQFTDVPVLPLGSGTVRVKVPIKVGDPCLLLFCSSSIARLKSTDGSQVVDPGDDRRHHAADVVAMPIPTIGASAADDDAMIEFTDAGLIKAGGDEPLVKRSEFLAHTHATAGTGTPSPPVSGPPGSAATFPGTSRLRG